VGGLAVGTVLICCIFAAMCGISGAATVSMGLIALPSMLKRGYSKQIAIGTVLGGGALGFLIPPSVVMIVYGLLARVSIGKLFIGGIIPGLILASFFIIYILIRCHFQPSIGPVLPRNERLPVTERIKLARALILPSILVITILGTIISGICSPTEASAIGAFGSIICSLVNRRFNWGILFESLLRTGQVTAMITWVGISAAAFSTIYNYLGATELIENLFSTITTSRIFVPIIKSFGLDPVWFGILYVVNMQMAFITPPFGFNIFYMKAVAPPEISLKDIYLSAYPFVICQALTLIIIVLFPELVLWLPNLLLR